MTGLSIQQITGRTGWQIPSRFYRSSIILLLFLYCCVALRAEYQGDVIESYHSNIVVQHNGQIIITETITAACSGVYKTIPGYKHPIVIPTIIHGIVRAIPTHTHTFLGLKRVTPVHIIGVWRDSKLEPYRLTNYTGSTVTLQVGDPKVTIPGEHTFILQYLLDNLLDYQGSKAILHWDALAPDWEFPIQEAQVTIQLPGEDETTAQQSHLSATAPGGVRITNGEKNSLILTTLHALAGSQGIACVLKFPRTAIIVPSPAKRRAALLHDNPIIISGPLILLYSLMGYLLIWLFVGRELAHGAIHPRGEPPALSPAATRYLWREGYDHLLFAVALVSMAIKQFLQIREDVDTFTIIRNEDNIAGSLAEQMTNLLTPTGKPSTLSTEEHCLAEMLLHFQTQFTFVPEEGDTVKETSKRIKIRLANLYQGKYFHDNRVYSIMGVIFTSLLTMFIVIQEVRGGYWLETLQLIGGVLLLGVLPFCIPYLLLPMWRVAITEPIEQIRNLYYTLLVTAGVLVMFIGGILVLKNASFPVLLLVFCIFAMNLLFAHSMKSMAKHMTRQGRQLRDHLAGFRLFLSGEVSEGWKQRYAPIITSQLFEEYLPYAIAMDVAPEWAKQCDEALMRSTPSGLFYLPGWYYGHAWNHGGTEQLIHALCKKLPFAIYYSMLPSGQESIESARQAASRQHAGGGGSVAGGGW